MSMRTNVRLNRRLAVPAGFFGTFDERQLEVSK